MKEYSGQGVRYSPTWTVSMIGRLLWAGEHQFSSSANGYPIDSLLCLQGGYGRRLDNGGARARADERGQISGKGRGLMRV